MFSLSWFIYSISLFSTVFSSTFDSSSFFKQLQEAEIVANTLMNDIATEWSIDQYPNFLRSMGTTRADWNTLVRKFQHKILQAQAQASGATPSTTTVTSDPVKFIISFMGSSVAAGHDSPFQSSFPVLVGNKMAPVLAKLGVELISKNVAMGNNPCMPYDVCVETFAGKDADIVHWEQTYNCGHGDNQRVLEQFVRQSTLLPNRPLIVFTDSDTPNWRKNDCPSNLDYSYNLTAEETGYLKVYHSHSGGLSEIATDNSLNKKSIHRKFGYMNHIIRNYKGVAAIQLWDHSIYRDYKCRGPYVADWHGHNAKWHPSLNGHRVRADHHTFFWVAAWRDAIISLRNENKLNNKVALLKSLDIHKAVDLPRPLVVSNISDRIQCFTNYEPRTERQSSIHALVVGGRAPADYDVDLTSTKRFSEKGVSSDNIGWKTEIYEALASAKIIAMANKAGYLDYKVVMYGSSASGPLSLLIQTHRDDGNIFLCEAPGIWGEMLKGFAPLWNASLELYVTDLRGSESESATYSADYPFAFQPDKAVKLQYFHTKVDELCMQVMQKLPIGRYVLTIVPLSTKKVTLATILVP